MPLPPFRFYMETAAWPWPQGQARVRANKKAKLTKKLPTRAIAKAQPKSARKAKAA
jgi:hypothetical protein